MIDDGEPVIVVAAFRSSDALVRAASGLDRTAVNTYTPTPLGDRSEGSRIRPVMAGAFIVGAACALAVQAWTAGFSCFRGCPRRRRGPRESV